MAEARFASALIPCDDPRFPFCHAATLVETLDGDLIAAWYAGTAEGAKDCAILSSRLRRGGWRWTTPRVIVDTPGQADGNPVLFVDSYGTLWLFYVSMTGEGWETCRVHARNSGDNGHSWDPAGTVQEVPGWMTRNKPVQLRSAEVVLPMYDERDWSSFMLVCTDSAHWEPRGEIRAETGVIQPAVIERSDGTLVAWLRRGPRDSERRLWRSESHDQGHSWSRPERTSVPNPNSAVDVVRLENGHLVLAFNNSPTERTPLSLALSVDQGKNWRFVRDLETDPGEYSYPAVIQSTSGDIHLLYTHQRRAIKHVVLEEEWIRAGGSAGRQ